MNAQRALELMRIEKQCIERASLPLGCDRMCADCDLVQDDRELVAAYEFVIGMLERGNV